MLKFELISWMENKAHTNCLHKKRDSIPIGMALARR